MDLKTVEAILQNQGYNDFKWIPGKDVVVSQWVRFKCTFGCTSYGKKGTCPPAVPSLQECREFFNEYNNIAVIHLRKKVDHPDDRKEWSRKANFDLLNLEKETFLAGFQKAFLLFMDECRICQDCAGSREECRDLEHARPGPEALGVDVFATVSKVGFPIAVLADYKQEMNRYSFLMVN